MIPNTLACIGPYADVWSSLKAMDHALARTLDPATDTDLTELDRDQLLALERLLRASLGEFSDEELEDLTNLRRGGAVESSYAVAFDLRQRLRDLPRFREWHSHSKVGYDKKVQDLLEALHRYLSRFSGQLFPKNVPAEEFVILRELLAKLMREAEPSLRT